MSDSIHREDHDHAIVLRLRHGKANTIDPDLFAALDEHLGDVTAPPHRALVLTGTGSIFSAGVDLWKLLDGGDAYADELLGGLSGTLRRLFTLPVPVVAAVNGHAIAGGCIVAAACDHRVMTDDAGAKIGITELRVGVPFPTLALEIMRDLVPHHHLRRMVLGGITVGPQDAQRMGLVDELADAGHVLDRALDVAARLQKIPARAFALSKRQLRLPAMERVGRWEEAMDRDAAVLWKDEATRGVIRGYLERTVGKR